MWPKDLPHGGQNKVKMLSESPVDALNASRNASQKATPKDTQDVCLRCQKCLPKSSQNNYRTSSHWGGRRPQEACRSLLGPPPWARNHHHYATKTHEFVTFPPESSGHWCLRGGKPCGNSPQTPCQTNATKLRQSWRCGGESPEASSI